MAKPQKNDKVILELKADIEKKEAQLKSSETFKPITNCMLQLFGQSYNLHVVDKNTLMFLASNLDNMEKSVQERFPGEELVINGYPVQAWITDVVQKYHVLNRKEEQKRLEALKKRLLNVLSAEKKTELEIEDIKASL